MWSPGREAYHYQSAASKESLKRKTQQSEIENDSPDSPLLDVTQKLAIRGQ